MLGKFVGIDLNNNNARVCVVDRSFTGDRIKTKESVSFQLGTGDSKNGKHGVAYSVLSKFNVPSYNICTAIAAPAISLKVLRFPFKDSNKVRQTYKFELDNETVYDPDEKINSYHLVKRDDYSEALVSMFEKSDVRSFLDLMDGYGIDPKFITYAPAAFSSLNGQLSNERPFLLVDVTCSDINFILFDEKGVRRVRSSREPFSDFVNGLGIKSGDDFTFTGLSGTDIEKEKFNPLVKETVRTMRFFEKELRDEIKSVVLTGELCLLNGVENIFKEGLNRPVSKIFIPDLGEEDSPIFARAYAIALYGAHSNQDSINLRINEFEFKSKSLDIRKNFLVPILLLAVFLTLTFYRSGSNAITSGNNVKILKKELQKEVKEVFPNIPSVIPDPVSFMQYEVVKVRDKISLIEEVKGGSTPLDVIRNITSIFSSNLYTRVDEIRFESEKRVKLWGRCNSYKDIAKVEKVLSESSKFTKVKREQVSQSTDNTVKFIMSMVVN